jgi:hypothetical protein
MNTWYSVDLGDGVAAYKPSIAPLDSLFTFIYETSVSI